MSDEALSQFHASAKEYCDWVRDFKDDCDRVGAMRSLQRLLTELHLAWIQVSRPEGEISYVDVATEDVTPIRRNFCEILPVDGYLSVWDPLDFDDKDVPIMSYLPDDIADIYGDLTLGLEHWREDRKVNAYADWNLRYDHWGKHLINASAVLFQYLHDFPDGSTSQRRRVWNDVAP